MKGLLETMSNRDDCPFCQLDSTRIVSEDDFCIAIRDQAPITKLHTLIITKRHTPNYFKLTQRENDSIWRMLNTLRETLLKIDSTITAFNIGTNVGTAAGQTVFHCHFHLIPRRNKNKEISGETTLGDFSFSPANQK